MDLIKTINCARRCRATLDRTYLILALIEVGAADTPFFAGLEGDELVISLMTLITIKEKDFVQRCLEDYDRNDFLGFLLSSGELKADPVELFNKIEAIKRQGESQYEFKKFDGLDPNDAGYEKTPGAGPA